LTAEALIAAFEQETSRALGHAGRRKAGLFYTPPAVAAHVVDVLLHHSGVRAGTLLDPSAGAGAFLVAAARAGLRDLRGIDLDPKALKVARAALRLCGAKATLSTADALRFTPRRPADLVLSNPPYGHVEDEQERQWILRRFPALRGGEIDRYAAFLLRALQLVRPGGAVGLLIPDTWMFLARSGSLREAVLAQAEIAAVADLGKPFAAAKDTRVQALVLVRKPAKARLTFVARGDEELAPAEPDDLRRTARRGWFLYRTRAERALCESMEASSVPLGRACAVGYGMRTGRNARYVARRRPGAGELSLVGGEDIVPFALRWRPKTLEHADELRSLVQRQLGQPRIGVQRIRTNAQAPWARWLEAAPIPPGMVCLDSVSTLSRAPEERLWALLALVSSVAVQRYHRLRTTDVNVKPSALGELPVPRILLEEPGALAELAKQRAAVAEGAPEARNGRVSGELEERRIAVGHALDRRIDAHVYALFGLGRELVEASERGFWGERFSEEIQRLEEAMSDPPVMVARQEGTA
jgi:methylase of polypeptide subunit release factors